MLTKVNNQIYNEVNVKSAPFLIILFLTFMILFGCTNITINAANNSSYILLVVILTITQIFLYFLLHNPNSNNYKIYLILASILITFALLYIIYIKRIYDEEIELIIELTNKDILEDTNVTC